MVPIYPARELPIEGVCSEMIGNNLSVKWQLIEREALAQALRTMDTDVVVTFGAGNIDAVCEDIYEVLKTKM
jgi:UDP-N-acetylmuramate--alanine ligase